MKMLVDSLSTWLGPQVFSEEITKRGLSIPEVYRNDLIEYCNACGEPGDLGTYWSECAKEQIFSGGRVGSDSRYFSPDATYRSQYLDNLATEQALKRTLNGNTLHPCLLRWRNEKALFPGLWEKLEQLKDREADEHKASQQFVDGWTGKKSDVKPILRAFAERRGFCPKKLQRRGLEGKRASAFCKETGAGLLFYIWIDTGGLPDATITLPLCFAVSHSKDEYFATMEISPESLCPGAEFYERFKSPRNAVYGVFALVEIFDAFWSTFS